MYTPAVYCAHQAPTALGPRPATITMSSMPQQGGNAKSSGTTAVRRRNSAGEKRSEAATAAAVSTGVISCAVPGVNAELASFLVRAIKSRRKLFSKSTSRLAEIDAQQGVIQDLRIAADDHAVSFINALRHQAAPRSSRRQGERATSSAAPKCCLKFLLELISDRSNNSVHLRRSSLSLARMILEKSAVSRAFFASGPRLLNFVSVIEGEEHDKCDSINSSHMTPTSMLQLEAVELVHYLASTFGEFYTEFIVASRLLGDLFIQFQQSNDNNSRNMKILRKERDIALEYGPKLCKRLERMIKRADDLLTVLVPRFGGFNSAEPEPLNVCNKVCENLLNRESPIKIGTKSDSKQTCEMIQNDDEGDEETIDWEEGDENFNEHVHETTADWDSHRSNKHQAAVEVTMDIMKRGGTLLDGELFVQIGTQSTEKIDTSNETHPDSVTALTSQQSEAYAKARQKMQSMVQKFSTHRLPCLRRWSHALSHADGMEERVVVDRAMAITSSNASHHPVSLVLLPEEKRFMRGQVLQTMIRVEKEVESILRSAAKLGIHPCDDGRKGDDNERVVPSPKNETKEPPVNGTDLVVGIKRSLRPEYDNLAVVRKKKKSKASRFRVIYHNK